MKRAWLESGWGRELLSDSAILMAGNAVSAVLAMAYSMMCARRLSPAGYAEVVTILSLSFFLVLFTSPIDTGITSVAAHAHGAGRRADLRGVLARGLRLSAAVAVPVLAGWLLLGSHVLRWVNVESDAMVGAVAAYVLGSFLLCAPRALLRGDHRFAETTVNQVFEAGVRLGFGLAFMLHGFSAAGAIGGHAAGLIAALLLGQLQLRTLPRGSADPPALAVRPQASALFVFHLYALCGSTFDVFTAKRMLTGHEAGLYAASTTLARALYLVSIPVNQVLFSRVAARAAGGQPVTQLVMRGLALLAGLLALSCIVPFGLGDFVLRLLFGEAFAGAVGTLRILWLTVALYSLQSAVAFVLIALERTSGFWLLLLPSAVLCGLLATYHDSAAQIALSGLAAAAVGTACVVGLVLLPGARTRPSIGSATGQPTSGTSP